MSKVISIGNQGFDKIRENDYFYVDKTGFIKEWWESGDDVTLITSCLLYTSPSPRDRG